MNHELLENDGTKKYPIKVLHMTMLGAGGISTLIVNINKCLDLNKVVFDYLVFREQKEFYEDDILALGEKKQLADVGGIKNKFRLYFEKYRKTKKILKDGKYDVVHVDATTPFDVVIGLAAKDAGVKTIVFHAHNSGEPLLNPIKRFCNKACKTVMPYVFTDYFSTSDIAAEFMFNKNIVRDKNYRIIRNGIDANRYVYSSADRRLIRNELGISDEFVLGHIGRFSPQKNHAFIIEVFNKLLEIKSDAKLILIGDGPIKNEIADNVKKLGIEKSVIFYGLTRDVPKLLSSMDAFIFPSRWEGLGIAGIEAQCSGLRTYCSKYVPDEADITDLFIKVESPDPKYWAEQIAKDFENVDAERHDRIAEVIKHGFDINTTAFELQNFYIERSLRDGSN